MMPRTTVGTDSNTVVIDLTTEAGECKLTHKSRLSLEW